MEPEVRYLILCDDVRADPNNFLRLNVFGLITHIRSTATPAFPVTRPQFCVLVMLTGCQGTGKLGLRILRAETGKIVFRNQPRRVRFVGSPQDAVGFAFRIQDCSFPSAGLYWVELVFDGTVLARQGLSLTT
jgi:hypothetical protein